MRIKVHRREKVPGSCGLVCRGIGRGGRLKIGNVLCVDGGVHTISIGQNMSTSVNTHAVVREIGPGGDFCATALRRFHAQDLHEPTAS